MPLPALSFRSVWTVFPRGTNPIWLTTAATTRSCSTQQLWQLAAVTTAAALPAAPALPRPLQSHAQVLQQDRCLRPRLTQAVTRRSCADLTRRTAPASTARSASSLTACRSWEQSTDIPSTRRTSAAPITRSVSARTARAVTSSTAWRSWQSARPTPEWEIRRSRLVPQSTQPRLQLIRPLRPTKLPPPLLHFVNFQSTRPNVCPHPRGSDPDPAGHSKVSAWPVWTVLPSHLEWAVLAVWVPACWQILKTTTIPYRGFQYSADCPIKKTLRAIFPFSNRALKINYNTNSFIWYSCSSGGSILADIYDNYFTEVFYIIWYIFPFENINISFIMLW